LIDRLIKAGSATVWRVGGMDRNPVQTNLFDVLIFLPHRFPSPKGRRLIIQGKRRNNSPRVVGGGVTMGHHPCVHSRLSATRRLSTPGAGQEK
jgi:hypothetical protein